MTTAASNTGALLECVPNFSEGMDGELVRRIIRATCVEGVHLLDYSLDADHNRSVVTLAGEPAAIVEAAVRAVGEAVQTIDLTRQTGVHPRIGAADVIPFVPLRGLSIAQAAMFARQAGVEIARRFGVPVYFYGAAATRPDRVELENVRRGQFEGLREAVLADSARAPDIGGPTLHPTAGACVVGARPVLVAYNVFLGEGAELTHARAIARGIRASDGGLPGVKAMGVLVDRRPQVTMNITDLSRTSIEQVHARVVQLAREHKVSVAEGELIGLLPEAAFHAGAAWLESVRTFDPATKIIERRLDAPLAWASV